MAVVSLFLVLLYLIPSTYVVGSIGATIGAPASLYALAMCVLWLLAGLLPGTAPGRRRQPLRAALFAFVSVVLISYALATRTGALDAETARSADRGVLYLFALVGVALLVVDGIQSVARLVVLLGRVVTAVTLVAALAILQYATKSNIVAPVFDLLPGLHATRFIAFAGSEQAVNRVSGTAIHPIELGVVIAMVLPLAVWFAVRDEVRTGFRRWWKVCVLLAAEPMAQSRSGLLVLIVAFAIFIPGLPRAVRRQLLVVSPIFIVLMRVTFPGLVGTIRNLFLYYSDDPSYQYRQQHAEQVGKFISQHPWFGRGFFTWDPTRAFVLDNQYLLSIVETGYVGLSAFIVVLLTGAGLAWRARRTATSDDERLLALALFAPIVGSAVAFGTFDFLTFPMAISTFMVLLGSAGALWRLLRDEARDPGVVPASTRPRHPTYQ